MTIRLVLQYGGFPVELYEDDGSFVGAELPEEWDEPGLENKLKELQSMFNELFMDNSYELQFTGFMDDDEKEKFMSLADEIEAAISQKCYGEYDLINDMDIDGICDADS